MDTFIRFLFRYFLCYTQSPDAMGLIFHAKLTVCFICNIYAGFILSKKCVQIVKIEFAMECPSSQRKFVSYKNIDRDQTTIVSEKK